WQLGQENSFADKIQAAVNQISRAMKKVWIDGPKIAHATNPPAKHVMLIRAHKRIRRLYSADVSGEAMVPCAGIWTFISPNRPPIPPGAWPCRGCAAGFPRRRPVSGAGRCA